MSSIAALQVKYPGTVIKDNGFNVWIFGNTKPHKDSLKADGFKWSTKKYGWWKKTDYSPEVIFLPAAEPVPAMSEDPSKSNPAGFLPAPVFDRERQFYQAHYKILSVAAAAGTEVLGVLKNWKGLYNSRLSDNLRTKISILIPENTESEYYSFYVCIDKYYQCLQLKISFSYRYKLHEKLSCSPSWETVRTYFSSNLPSRSRQLTAEEKAEIYKTIEEQKTYKSEKAEIQKNIFWNLPDLQAQMISFSETISKMKSDFFSSNAAYSLITSERKYNNALSSYRLYDIQ